MQHCTMWCQYAKYAKQNMQNMQRNFLYAKYARPSLLISKSSCYYITIIPIKFYIIIGIIAKRSVPYAHYLTVILLLFYYYALLLYYYSTHYSTYYALLNFSTILCTIKLPIMHYYGKCELLFQLSQVVVAQFVSEFHTIPGSVLGGLTTHCIANTDVHLYMQEGTLYGNEGTYSRFDTIMFIISTLMLIILKFWPGRNHDIRTSSQCTTIPCVMPSSWINWKALILARSQDYVQIRSYSSHHSTIIQIISAIILIISQIQNCDLGHFSLQKKPHW
jgi:hypothetical protein